MAKLIELWGKFEDENGKVYLMPITFEDVMEMIKQIKNPLDK